MAKIYYDFHIHSCLSPCGDEDMTPANIAGMAYINGLDAIALADHNTTLNCTALKQAAEQFGITVLYGMELTTEEEVHILCLFAEENFANEWADYVYARLIKVKNNPDIFGKQIIMDNADKVLGEEENLLINATTISFDEVFDLVDKLGGIAIPAHVDKNANSIISNLGFVPPDSKFTVAEMHDINKKDKIFNDHTYFKNCKVISNSDAHYLENINTKVNFLELEDTTATGIINFLKGK